MPQPANIDVNGLFDPRVLRYIMIDMCATPRPSAAQIAENLLGGYCNSPLSVFWTVAVALKSDEVINNAHEIQQQDYQRHPTAEELRTLLPEVFNALAASVSVHQAFEQLGTMMGFVRECNPVAADSLQRAYTQAIQQAAVHNT